MEAAIVQPPKKKRRFGRPDHALRRANLALPGLDLRSQEGRRYALVITELIAEHGEGELTRLRELAALRTSLEQTQVEAMRGSLKAREDSVRLANLITRREAELRSRIRPRDVTPSLADIAARHRNGGSQA
jgi:hypothetical protein